MSGESQTMERSTLERKDRAELAAVAEALGLKVPSRAKKADIVTLILDAVGQASPAEAPASGQASLLDAEPAAAATEPVASEPAASNVESGETAERADAQADPQPEAAKPAGRSTNRRTRNAAPAEADNASAADNASSDARESAAEAAPETAAGDAAQGDVDADAGDGDASADGGADDGADDSGEGGSSRRRRRRRGRDRGEGGEGQPQGQGQGQGQPANDSEPEPVEVQGLLDLRDDGYGFLRVSGFVAGREDVYVSVKQCRQLGLRKGDYVSGLARPASHKEKNPALVRVETVNGLDPEAARDRVRFDELTAIDATEQIVVGGRNSDDLTGDLIDAISPIRQGQRSLVVAPVNVDVRPVLSSIAAAVEQGLPDAHLIVLLIDETPENVTSFRKSLDGGELVSAAYDRPADQQAAVAELALEHAKRLVEYGNDVVVLIDSLTGLTRAYNLSTNPGGRMIAGELDASALAAAKRVFGAARNVEDGGSLTIVATALSETRSQVDEAIVIELQRGANSTLVLEAAAPPVPARPLVVGASLAEQKSLLSELTK